MSHLIRGLVGSLIAPSALCLDMHLVSGQAGAALWMYEMNACGRIDPKGIF
jgi:hypothetical protein